MARSAARDEQLGAAAPGEGSPSSVRGRRLRADLVVVLAIMVPGLGHVAAGRLRAGLAWFLAVCVGYYALVFFPGVVLHGISVWFAHRALSRAADERGADPAER